VSNEAGITGHLAYFFSHPRVIGRARAEMWVSESGPRYLLEHDVAPRDHLLARIAGTASARRVMHALVRNREKVLILAMRYDGQSKSWRLHGRQETCIPDRFSIVGGYDPRLIHFSDLCELFTQALLWWRHTENAQSRLTELLTIF
jgi:hypothetical protein